jgi:hypothetical protein
VSQEATLVVGNNIDAANLPRADAYRLFLRQTQPSSGGQDRSAEARRGRSAWSGDDGIRAGHAAPESASPRLSLERRIRAHLSKGSVQVTLTDNRYTMISVRRIAKERRYEVRLHHMFADADP